MHEAWLRLRDQPFENRTHFFTAAAEAMRRILIESARRKLAARHGGDWQRTELDSINMPAAAPDKADDLLALDEALEELAAVDDRKAQLVQLRCFVGLEISEAAEVLLILHEALENLAALILHEGRTREAAVLHRAHSRRSGGRARPVRGCRQTRVELCQGVAFPGN